MPFTPTHVLAVLPLHRRLPLAALAIGAMVPDFPLYFSVGPTYATTHSAPGIVIACLPLGLAVWLLFEHLLRAPLSALLPARRQAFLRPVSEHGGAAAWVLAACAVAIGAVTHVVWDAFTHQGRWGTVWWPFLNETYTLGPLRAPGYNWFQHGSSAVGLPLLAWFAWRRWRAVAPPAEPLPNRHRRALLAMLIVVPTARGLVATLDAPANLGARLYDLATVGGRWLVLGVLLYALAYRWRPGWFAPAGVPASR